MKASEGELRRYVSQNILTILGTVRVKYIQRFTAAHSCCCTHVYERMWQKYPELLWKMSKSRLVYLTY